MNADATNWMELREFKSVDLTKSYVLSWDTESESLLIDIDLFLCPDHPSYEKPRPSERVCIRPAFIEFPWCTGVAADGHEKAEPVADTIRSFGAGRIDGLQRFGEGRYEISGQFGSIEILAERPMVRLKGNQV